MADMELASPFVDATPSVTSADQTATIWTRLALAATMIVSIVLNFWQLGQNGFGNQYYAAGVRSMLNNWHTFFFVSYDPGGFVSLDKPPLGFWLQVLSAKIFGFTPFAVLLPQALAGVASVGLLYYLVKRHFGAIAGLLAALFLALSPISVATNRNNTIDSTLALVLLLGAWAVFKATETGKVWWLILGAAFVGLGFNIKMLEAYLVVPAFALVYLVAAPGKFWTRVLHLLAAGATLIVISIAWLLAVDLTPASLRPYVGSSGTNSEFNLAFGYNGLSRLTGNQGTPGGAGATSGGFSGHSGQPPFGGNGGQPPFGGNGQPPTGAFGNGGPSGMGGNRGGPAGQGGTGMFNTGLSGPMRLFTLPLAAQIAWILPIAIAGIVALAVGIRQRARSDKRTQSLILWGTWLVTMAVFFSAANFFHQYYLTELAPAIAALAGIGIVVMWQQLRQQTWVRWLLPVAIALTTVQQLVILSGYTSEQQYMPVVAVLGFGGALGLAVIAFDSTRFSLLAQRGVISAALAGLLIVPFVWSVYAATSGAMNLPLAGPSASSMVGAGPGNDSTASNSALIQYLEAHKGNATYLVATPSSMQADAIILATNEPVMALGGFNGSDTIVTSSQLQALVKAGTVRYFLLNSGGPSGRSGSGNQGGPQNSTNGTTTTGTVQGGGPGAANAATTWVTQSCTSITVSGTQLYDCGTQG